MHEATPARGGGPDLVLAGPLRGGTTLLRLLMSSHPSIAAVGELEEVVSQAGDHGWPDLDTYRLWLSQNRAALMKGYHAHEHTRTYPELVNAMWEQLAARETKPRIACTIHSRFDRVPDLWPDCTYVFLVRDPRDVARSCVGMGWIGEPTSGASYWTEPVRRWIDLRDRLDPSRYVELRYEDLVRDPEPHLDACCRLVGERYHPDMLTFHERSSYDQLDASLAYQWKLRLSTRQAELIELRSGDLLDRFGYERSVAKPRSPGPGERAGLIVSNRLGRLRWRIERYGLALTLAWTLVKRLPLRSRMRRAIKTRLNAIDTRHLR